MNFWNNLFLNGIRKFPYGSIEIEWPNGNIEKFFANKNKDEFIVNHNQNTGLSRGTRTWLNISGIGLTLSGILKEEKVLNNPQTIAGVSIVVATFLLDLILKDF